MWARTLSTCSAPCDAGRFSTRLTDDGHVTAPAYLDFLMLHLHRAERADVLVDALGDVLGSPLPDPLQPEVVAVPTRGVERWLTQRLAHRLGTSAGGGRGDGVCGNLEFPFPGRLVGNAISTASGVDRDEDPWLPERAVWPLLEVIDDFLDEAWLATLSAHLRGGSAGNRSRRFSTARHLADLFDRYGVHRPAMVRSWAAGDDVAVDGQPLPADVAWQAELWRLLRARVGEASPAERLERACAALVADASLADLPERISIFGLTRLPASYLDVLRAVAAHRDVHLFLLHPSPVLWDRMAGKRTGIVRRADDPTADTPRNPLLRSWGRDAREMQLVLADGAAGGVVDEHRATPPSNRTTLLTQLQEAIRQDALPEAFDVADGDRSLQVHAAHGRARQVEVLRDAILHLLADDPSLETRDVIVMCPDIETFAPLIHATFGPGGDAGDDGDEGEVAGPTDLRVRLADRSLRQTNPVLSAISALLELADARVTATQVLDFAAREPVRRRFRFDDDDLERMGEWVSSTAIRWGLDGEHRAPFKLGNVEQNTWRAGLDRVLLGVTMAEEDQRLVDNVLPLDDVDSGAIDLAGRFAELVDRLEAAVDGLAVRKPVAAWGEALADAADALFAVRNRNGWQRSQLQRIVDEVSVESGASGVELELADVRALLADRLRGQPTRANFRTGHLTFCTLVPMRSVPHRVVCLLGLDDDAFPRRTERDGDDLVAADAFVGDGDGRSEDRQLLLDALLAATETLVITYSGHDERTNAELAPAVPVGELLDAVGVEVAKQIVVHHPLQPFDPRNFSTGTLGRDGAWSFDPVTLRGAKATVSPREAPAPFLPERLAPPVSNGVIELDALVKFMQHPARAFLRQRLEISLGDFTDEIVDAMPVELNALQSWAVGDRVLQSRLSGVSAEACAQAERARGDLPPDCLAPLAYDKIAVNVESVMSEVEKAIGLGGEVDSVEVAVALDDGRLVVGTVPGVVGSVVRSVFYSKIAAKHRVAAWVRFLTLAAGRPDDGLSVVTIGRSNAKGANTTTSTFAPFVDADAARRHLHELVALYDRGMCEPLPIACVTSCAWAEAVRNQKDPASMAAKAWAGEMFGGEDADAEHVLVYGGQVTFDDVLALPLCDGEDGEGWSAEEATRFGRYARRLWDGLLDTEELGHAK